MTPHTALIPLFAASFAASLPGLVWSATGVQAGEGYGWAASDLADIDGDGARDAIVSAPFHTDSGGNMDGRVQVLSGRTGAVITTKHGGDNDVFGWAIADAGDVSGDGVHDVVVGAPQGFGQCPLGGFGAGRVVVLDGRTGEEILVAHGEQTGDAFGFAVAGAGDVNQDGRADLLVGAPCVGQGAGRVSVVDGATGGVLRTRDGQPGDGLGSGTGNTGDLNQDGEADHVVGARNANGGSGGALVLDGGTGGVVHTLSGDATNIEFGTFFTAGVGDVDADGTPDVYVADYAAGNPRNRKPHARGKAYVFSGATGERIWVFTGEHRGDGLGPGRAAGDVDGDGHADLVIGSYNDSDGAPSAGKVEVYSGATGEVIRTWVSERAGEQLGFDAIGLGDTDGDGDIDLLLTAASGDAVYLVSS